jgi:hypothetical protein
MANLNQTHVAQKLLVVATAVYLLAGCNSEKKQADRSGAENPTAGSENQTGSGSPAPGSNSSSSQSSTSPAPQATDLASTCQAQWNSYVAYFTVGKIVTYNTKVQSGSQVFPINHSETITESNDKQVVKTLNLQATTSLGTQLLNQFRRNPSMTVTKEKFNDVCIKGQGKYLPEVAYAQSAFQVTSSTAEQVAITQGTFASQHVKGAVNVTLTTKQILANGDVWISAAVPGLILKHVITVPSVPVLGAVTITGELTSQGQ